MKNSTVSSTNVLTQSISEPLNGTVTAKVDITTDTANLEIGRLTGDGQTLASGALQYGEKMSPPTRIRNSSNGQTDLTLSGSGSVKKSLFRLPWAACNAYLEWQVQLNPKVAIDLTAHSGGGNVKLNLAGLTLTNLSADTGGGNMEVILPDNIAGINVQAKTGAGNVDIQIPGNIEAMIHATTGLGKVIMDPRFNKMDDNTYQSADYEKASKKVEITLKSGAGNVSVTTKSYDRFTDL